jgi:hypothetical protein
VPAGQRYFENTTFPQGFLTGCGQNMGGAFRHGGWVFVDMH